MKRRLTSREIALLCILVCIATVSAYVLLFYMPMKQELASLQDTAQLTQTEIEAAQQRVEEKARMEAELKRIFAENPNPVGLAEYDNLQRVMFELNTILSGTREYNLSFGTVDAEQDIVRRSISMRFSSASYENAKNILQQLNESAYRCMMDDINISIDRDGGAVTVNGTIVFFEYQ